VVAVLGGDQPWTVSTSKLVLWVCNCGWEIWHSSNLLYNLPGVLLARLGLISGDQDMKYYPPNAIWMEHPFFHYQLQFWCQTFIFINSYQYYSPVGFFILFFCFGIYFYAQCSLYMNWDSLKTSTSYNQFENYTTMLQVHQSWV
jgi:hypothetical protein